VDVPEKQRVSGKSYKRLPGRNAISKSVYARAARFFFEAIREVMVNIKILLLITAGIGMAFTAVADERLDLLKNISAAGAPELTIKMLDQAQPKVDADLYEWILWEQERLAILAHWKQWDMLLVRIEGLPDDIPQQFKQQAATYQARAFLELGQTVTARKILRQQLWQTVASEAPQYETWRRQIIESYIEDGRIEDARVAMLRFDQDFDSTDLAWLLLRARVLIESGRHEQAILVLRDQKAWQARLTSMLASFRLKQIDQGELWAQVRKRSEEETVEAQERASLWALGYFAAEKMAPVDRVVALESLFRSEVESPLQLFQLPVDLLWQAYLQYAELVGNRSELLLGADEKWLELAARTSKETPVKARSLYAMLMLKSVDSEVANRAATGYMGTFAEIDEAEHHLLQNLFNHSGTFPSARDIPAGIRYQLVDLALRSADIEEATRLMSGLNTVPAGTSRFDWQLRQSRVLILGGRYEEGNQVLQSLIGEYREADTESTDRILQVLFDLQTVNLYAESIAHFNQLLLLELDPGQRREILFWIADSYRGLEKFEQAALLYLQSAMLPSPDAMDPWAQTARFNAAESLQESGLIDDARRIYEELLSVTQDVARRSVLNHKIQQLWLTQAAQ
jgi:tetratricopeptide (TPR) repeat protein